MTPDDKLKAALAKMLTGHVKKIDCGELRWIWNAQPPVLDTELLHLCSLVEDGLTDDDHYRFRGKLAVVILPNHTLTNWSESYERQLISPTWQQRVTALAKIKNIEL